MSKIWFCRNCGYEVTSRGRCHACKARLSSSPLPELEAGDEEDEVGYRLPEWTDRMRGRLIVRLIEANVLHRFDDDDELVVTLDDEARTDDLVEEIAAGIEDDGPDEDEDEDPGSPVAVVDPGHAAAQENLLVEVETLLGAAHRLRQDPTDMQAEGDLGLASGAVFMAESFDGADPETWAAVGRVTRRLLGALGAEEALEDEIRLQAGILEKLVEPLVDAEPVASDGSSDALSDGLSKGAELADAEVEAVAAFAADDAADGDAVSGASAGGGDDDAPAGEASAGEASAGEASAGEDEELEDDEAPAGESVYELPDWLPEQRAELTLHLDEASIPHEWEGGDLVVARSAEAEVEALFDQIEGVATDEDDEARYRSLEALFAAADRFVNDPDSRPKRMEVVRAVAEAEGPTPLGLDDAQWWSIRSRARLLADSIEHDASLEATTLRDMLRVLV